MSLALSNFAGLTLSTSPAPTVRCCKLDKFCALLFFKLYAYSVVFTLYEKLAFRQLFNNPALNKGFIGILDPDVSLSREIVLSFYVIYLFLMSSSVGRTDKTRRKGAGCR